MGVNILCELLAAILTAILIGFWTRAWLDWMMKGDVRAWIISACPAKWLAGMRAYEICEMTRNELNSWLVTTFDGPGWLAKLLLCKYCLSAHIAGAGALLAVCAGLNPFVAALAWAAGAALGLDRYTDYSEAEKAAAKARTAGIEEGKKKIARAAPQPKPFVLPHMSKNGMTAVAYPKAEQPKK